MTTMKFQKNLNVILSGIGLCLLFVFHACSSDRAATNTSANQNAAAAPAVPVTAEKVVTKEMPVEINAIGNVQVADGISVKSQVSGQLLKVHFKEGDNVKKGQLLFTIDSRPFEQAVKQAEATLQHDVSQVEQSRAALAKDAAQANYAKVEAWRYDVLLKEGIVSRETAEQYKANSEAYQETLRADQSNIKTAQFQVRESEAALGNAKVQLSYCRILAPIDGRTGSLIVTEGNLVTPNDASPLVILNKMSPIYATFTVPEKNLSDVQKYASSGNLKVVAQLDDNTSRDGRLESLDNQVNAATGTLQLKASFPNGDNALFPGRFVRVVLTLTNQPDSIVIPSQALQTSQQGQFVYVVKPDQTVELRNVTLDRTIGDEAVISQGLNEGETVVTTGQLRLTPGAKVQITDGSGNSTNQDSGNSSANQNGGGQ